MPTPMRSPEMHESRSEFAACLLVRHNSDVQLKFNDDRRADGLVDYLITSAGGVDIGALEVGTNTSESRTASETAWQKHARDPVDAPTLRQSWSLMCWTQSPANFSRLHRKVIPVLERLEAAGQDRCDTATAARYHAGTPEHELANLQVVLAHALPPRAGKTAQVVVNLAGGGASRSEAEAPLSHLEDWLHSPDPDPAGMRSKLAATGLSQRHAFVWVDFQSEFAAHRWLREGELPQRAPRLPTEVTHVWLASGSAGWSWSPAVGWAQLDFADALADMASLGPTYPQWWH
jgi:hypothetical protein